MDKLGELIMSKFEHRRRVGEKMNTKILPTIIKKLTALSRTLGNYDTIRSTNDTVTVISKDPKGNIVKDVVDINTQTCTCRQWQMTVDRFKAAYEGIIYSMTDKGKWAPVDTGFKIHPPVIRRQPGRPRNQRIKGSEEPGDRKTHTCKRCGQMGHHWPNCKHGQSGEGSNDPAALKPPPAKKTSKKDSTGSYSVAASKARATKTNNTKDKEAMSI